MCLKKIEGDKVKVAQLCLTLCDAMDYRVHGILQARILEWVTFPFSRGSSQSGNKPSSPALQADSLPPELSGKPEGDKKHFEKDNKQNHSSPAEGHLRNY